ncbi:MAG: A/G-specific adenine glycosylase [Gemmatimonadota bacterium]|nr:A/G-specific adenine glycosylase [Gemmatimonadota bacterium]
MPPRSRELSFKRRLLRWFRANGRDLPWRATRDPYRILVSEFMLQQTQVSRVQDFYPRFLRRFPTLADLARARPSRVREAWDGLGYYRRAANLHALARTVVRDHAGTIPDDPAALEQLPGVGRYTAGAVAAFAYERRVPAVDTNVARVLRRVFRRTERRKDGPADRRKAGRRGNRPPAQPPTHHLWSLAERLLPTDRRVAWEFGQALMDLGATVCLARKPKCGICPVRAVCGTGRRKNVST